MIRLPGMLMVGSTAKHVGKTELVCSLIAGFGERTALTGVKVTMLGAAAEDDPSSAVCGESHSACTLGRGFELVEETGEAGPTKDTVRMLAAGAGRVLWLRVHESCLAEAATFLTEQLGPNTVSICESTSLRKVVLPGLFLLIRSTDSGHCKPSAAAVRCSADRIVPSNGTGLDVDLDEIDLVNGVWQIRRRGRGIEQERQ